MALRFLNSTMFDNFQQFCGNLISLSIRQFSFRRSTHSSQCTVRWKLGRNVPVLVPLVSPPSNQQQRGPCQSWVWWEKPTTQSTHHPIPVGGEKRLHYIMSSHHEWVHDTVVIPDGMPPPWPTVVVVGRVGRPIEAYYESQLFTPSSLASFIYWNLNAIWASWLL